MGQKGGIKEQGWGHGPSDTDPVTHPSPSQVLGTQPPSASQCPHPATPKMLPAPTSTCPKVCTRGTTSSLWSSASCWIQSMSSSLERAGTASVRATWARGHSLLLLFLLQHPAPPQVSWLPHTCGVLALGPQILTQQSREQVCLQHHAQLGHSPGGAHPDWRWWCQHPLGQLSTSPSSPVSIRRPEDF